MNRILKIDLKLLDMQIVNLEAIASEETANNEIWGIHNLLVEIADALEDYDEVVLTKEE